MSLTTIDFTINADLFRNTDPIGLLRDISARAYQIELRRRLKDQFPNANVFLKWNPNRTGPADVFTLPDDETARSEVLAIAEQLEQDSELWLSYDDSIRAAR